MVVIEKMMDYSSWFSKNLKKSWTIVHGFDQFFENHGL